MTLETLPLRMIRPSKDNPRSAIDAERIEGLAASINTDGLLQNLVVAPLTGPGSKGQYGLISGHRRYAALCLLHEHGDLADGYQVPVTKKRREAPAFRTLLVNAILTAENRSPFYAKYYKM